MTDLDKLIEAVEGGDWGNPKDAFPDHKTHMLGYKAYHGSLDAAKALHEVLLPGWEWGRDPNGFSWVSFKTQEFGATDHIDNPARAWLIAILKAYRSTL